MPRPCIQAGLFLVLFLSAAFCVPGQSRGGSAQAVAAYRTAAELSIQFPLNTIYNIACCYALMGETDQAFNWLERAIGEGLEDRVFLLEDSDLNSLHGDPRWREVAG